MTESLIHVITQMRGWAWPGAGGHGAAGYAVARPGKAWEEGFGSPHLL